MIPSRTALTVAHRILQEFFRDPRSRVVLVVTPGLLLVVVRYLFHSSADFSRTGVLMIGVFPAFSMCLFGSTALVRERSEGTLEKLLTTPVRKVDLVGGYAYAAVVAALVQAVVTVTVAYEVVKLHTASPIWLVGLLTTLCGVFGMSLGLCVSAISKNEGEAFQFLPGVMIPQMLVSGVVWPVSQMGGWVQHLASALPLSAVANVMTDARLHSFGGAPMLSSIGVLVAIIVAALGLAVLTVDKRTASL